MKKIIAWMATIAMASTMFVTSTSAANVDFTITNTSDDLKTFVLNIPTWMDIATDWYVNVRLTTTSNWAWVDLTWNAVMSWSFEWDTSTDDLFEAWDSNWRFRITAKTEDPADWADINFVLTNPLADNVAYTISVNSPVTWDFWAAMINFWTSNQVNVSADVEPILIMDVQNTNIAFWTLTPDTVKQSRLSSNLDIVANLGVQENTPTAWADLITEAWKDTNIADAAQNTNTYVNVSTNAADWYVVSVSNAWLKDPQSWSTATNPTATITVEWTALWWAWDTDPVAADITIDWTNFNVDLAAWANNNAIATAIQTAINGTASYVAAVNANVITITNPTAWTAKNWVTIDTTALSNAINTADVSDDDTVLSATNFWWGQDYADPNEIPAVASSASAANLSHNTENLSIAAWYGYWINAYTLYDWETIDWKTSDVSAVQPTWVDYTWTDNTKVWALRTTAQPLVFSQWPVSKQVTAVKFFAKVSPLQEAWNYTDTVTFTVTWNF